MRVQGYAFSPTAISAPGAFEKGEHDFKIDSFRGSPVLAAKRFLRFSDSFQAAGEASFGGALLPRGYKMAETTAGGLWKNEYIFAWRESNHADCALLSGGSPA
jgi:hypothetical protein